MKSVQKIQDEFRRMLQMKNLVLFFMDAVVITISFFIAVLIGNDFVMQTSLIVDFITEIPIVIFIYWITFEIFQMYKSLWEFASLEEILKGIIANAVATIISFIIISYFFTEHLPGSFYVVAFFVVTFSTLFSRLFYRIVRIGKKYFVYEAKNKTALIVGAGDAGVMVLHEVNRNVAFEGSIVGFLDDDPKKICKIINGVTVLDKIDNIKEIIDEYNISIVYVAVPTATKERVTHILNMIQDAGAQIKLFPPFYEVMQDNLNKELKLRDVKIEDLLGRDVIKLDEDGIKNYIDSKTVLVTGGGGSIGSELVRQIRKFGPSKIVILDIYENNAYDLQMELERAYRNNTVRHQPEIVVLIASVRDVQRLDEIFEKYKPDVVFHAAAHKHVPLMEVSPKEAIKNNVFGTYNVAKMSDKHKVNKFVLISTDKAVNPTNVMGATKRFAERIVMAFNSKSETEYAAVRFGNVLGSNGSVIPLFKKQIEDGGPVTVTHPDIIRYFMTIPEASQLVIQSGAYAKGGELFVLDMGEQVNIKDLAEKMIRLSGLEPYTEIPIVFTGLRPGEKMYEELLVDYDSVCKTSNNLIYIDTIPTEVIDSIEEELTNIKSILDDLSVHDVKTLMKKHIDTYIE